MPNEEIVNKNEGTSRSRYHDSTSHPVSNNPLFVKNNFTKIISLHFYWIKNMINEKFLKSANFPVINSNERDYLTPLILPMKRMN